MIHRFILLQFLILCTFFVTAKDETEDSLHQVIQADSIRTTQIEIIESYEKIVDDLEKAQDEIHHLQIRLDKSLGNNRKNLWELLLPFAIGLTAGFLSKLGYDEFVLFFKHRSNKRYLRTAIAELATCCPNQIDSNETFINAVNDLHATQFDLTVTIRLSSNVLDVIPQQEIYKMYLRGRLKFNNDSEVMNLFSQISLAKIVYEELMKKHKNFHDQELYNVERFDSHKKDIMDYRKSIPRENRTPFDSDFVVLFNSYINEPNYQFPDVTNDKLILPLVTLSQKHDFRDLLIPIEGCVNAYINFQNHRETTTEIINTASEKLAKIQEFCEDYCSKN